MTIVMHVERFGMNDEEVVLWALGWWCSLPHAQRTDQKWIDLIACCRELQSSVQSVHPMDDEIYKEGLRLLNG